MKFKDPLATLYYLGGSFPTHLAMGIYSGVVFFYQKPRLECENVLGGEMYYFFQSVFEMFVAHSIYVTFILI
jgi:hypothetical protein